MRLLASPLPEARDFGEMALEELRKVIPASSSASTCPTAAAPGSTTCSGLRERASAGRRALRARRRARGGGRLVRAAAARRRLRGGPARGLPLRGERPARGRAARGASPRSSPDERAALIARARSASARTGATSPGAASRRCATGSRSSPTTAPSATSSATGCSPASGSGSAASSAPTCPRRSRTPASATATARDSRSSRAEWERLRAEGLDEEAPYAVSLAYRIRYVLDLNAREAMHLIELRSGREGHAELPGGRARDARPDRRGAPVRRGGDDATPTARPRLASSASRRSFAASGSWRTARGARPGRPDERSIGSGHPTRHPLRLAASLPARTILTEYPRLTERRDCLRGGPRRSA